MERNYNERNTSASTHTDDMWAFILQFIRRSYRIQRFCAAEVDCKLQFAARPSGRQPAVD